jgi:acetyl esterase/lipase
MNKNFRLICIVFTLYTSLLVAGCELQPQWVVPVSTSKLGTIEKDVTYCDVDGLSLKMDIYYPKVVSGLVPAVLYLHGGSFTMGDKADIFDVNELLTRGYLVASINYRLAPQYKFPAQIEDAKCAVRYLRGNAKQLGLDTAHIGVLGFSAGATLAALLGLTDSSDGFDGSGGWIDQSNSVQAVVDIAGPSNWVLLNDDSYRNNLDQLFGASNYDSEKLYWASPIKYVSKNSAPFLIAHGDKDDVVPLEQSQILYNRLKSCDVPVTFIVAKNATHIWNSSTPNVEENIERVYNFFDKYLK